MAVVTALAALPYVDLAGPVPLLQALAPIGGVVLATAGLVVAVAAVAAVVGVLPVALGGGRHRAGIAPFLSAALCLVAGGAMLWPVLAPPRAAGADATEGSQGTGSLPGVATSLSVLSLNTEYGQADPAAIVEQVRVRRVDLLVLLEETPQHWAALQEAGLSQVLPHVTGSVGQDAGGSLIASAHPLTCPGSPSGRCALTTRGERRGSGTAFDQPVAELADGTLVRAAHPWPPRPDPARWRSEQDEMGRWLRQHARRPLVVAGDFNAGPVHPVFRAVTAGFDRSPRHGLPWVRTWPMSVPGLGDVSPFVQIDHIVAGGRVGVEESVVRVPGTDHAAVWARLEPQP